jgi:hypothetical protein
MDQTVRIPRVLPKESDLHNYDPRFRWEMYILDLQAILPRT